jgi:hypothetical protein
MIEPMLEDQEHPLTKPPKSSGSTVMTPEQCAEFLGIKINILYVMKSQGRIPYRKVGHLLRFDSKKLSNGPGTKTNDFGKTAAHVLFAANLCGCNRRTEVMFIDS